MTVKLKLEIEGLSDLFDDGFQPGQIYEICVAEGAYKLSIMQRLPRAYQRTAVIFDQDFYNLQAFIRHLERLSLALDLLIVDIEEILYIQSAKDFEAMQADLRTFYECIERFSQRGTTCIIFTDYSYYDDQDEFNTIQIQMRPCLSYPPYWEATILNPPEWQGRRSYFCPESDEVPFLYHV
jgi:hypothetical protein